MSEVAAERATCKSSSERLKIFTTRQWLESRNWWTVLPPAKVPETKNNP